LDLNTLLQQVSPKSGCLRLAAPDSLDDNKKILSFFEANPMKGSGLQLRYERGPDFFEFLRDQSDRFFVFVYENKKGEIRGIATISTRLGYISGKLTRIGYLGDLRISLDRGLAKTWRNFYGLLMHHAHEITELERCSHFYTAVIDSNTAALKALVEHKRNTFTYRAIEHYEMVNLFGRYPWLKTRQFADVKIRRANSSDLEKVFAFLDDENRNLAFGFSPQEWGRRLERWPDFSASSYWIVENREGTILGCTALWSPSLHKRIIVESIPRSTRALFAIASPLLLRQPRVQQKLEVLYLTQLTWKSSLELKKRQELFAALLDAIHQSGELSAHHMLAYSDFRNRSIVTGTKAWITHRTSMTLYQVSPKNSTEPPSLQLTSPVAFEMALV
jgi:hypothetical protein